MKKAIATADLAASGNAYRIVFQSIGSASPGNAAAIAIGLGVSVGSVMEALYRAPSVLVDGLSHEVGTQMQTLLSELGCKVMLEAHDAPLPDDPRLFDVALHIEDTARYSAIATALAVFLGTTPDEAARLISTPPGVILGKVSDATITALRDRLGEGASLIASEPDAALYDIFLAPCDRSVTARLLGDLRRRGWQPLAETGCLLAGLTRSEADTLWSAHQRITELRVVNREFLRFDLVLTGGLPSPASTRALIEVAGIPAHIVPRLFEETDITVMEALPNKAMTSAMERLTSAGLEIRADLITFLHLGVEITDAPQPRAISQALNAMGIETSETQLRRLPYRLPYHMPELQARMLRDTLECSGARASLIDPLAEGATS